MKLKKLLAAVTAAALAVTTMAVTSFTASAADEPYILLNVHSTNYKIDGSWKPANKTTITSSKTDYEFSFTASDDDTLDNITADQYGNDSAAIEVYFYSGIDNLKNAKIASVSINDEDKGISVNAEGYNQWTWEQLLSTTTGGYKAKVPKETVEGLSPISSGDVLKIVVHVELDESAKGISKANFTSTAPANKELSVGDSFTITFDPENTPDDATFSFKFKIPKSATASDPSNDFSYYDVVIDKEVMTSGNGATETGLTVTKSGNVYTFTATAASTCEFPFGINLEYKGGTVTSTKYDTFGDGFIVKSGSNVGPGGEGGGNEGGDTPTPPPAGGSTIWEGTAALAWGDAEKEIPTVAVIINADKFASLKAGDTVKITFTPGDGGQFKFAENGDGWPGLTASPSADPTFNSQYYVVNATASPYELVIASEDVAKLKATGLIIHGHDATVTKVELVSAGSSGSGEDVEHTTHTGGTATCQAKAVCTVCGLEYGELAAHTYSGGVCTVCGAADPNAAGSGGGSGSGSGGGSTPSAPSTSSSSTSVSQTTIIDKILATPDGGSGSVNLGSSTKVDKLAIEAIATKGDVTIKLNVAGGAYWEINGQNVSDAKDVNLGVKVNSKAIPASKVEDFAGEKTTVQLSLSHNGDFGFTGTLNVPVGSANNGKFANLYYYHGGKFDFVGSSPIKGGRTQFAFSHASNYLIVIDDYAYGEDVSSAAGMTETTETDAFPYVAVLVVISAFGASAIVLKKRLSK